MPPKRKERKSKTGSTVKSKSSKSVPVPASQDSSPLSSPSPAPLSPLPLAPVHKCPSEILLDVFGFYTAKNPRTIRRLLLVCKRWYNLAINTTQLWTRLPFLIPHPEGRNPKRTFESVTVAFIKACLKHAGNSLLHIDACFACLISDESYLGHIENRSLSLDDMEEDPLLNFADIQRPFALITGKNGGLMHRWASLELMLPGSHPRFDTGEHEGYLRRKVYELLIGPTPNLTKLTILSLHKYDDLSGSLSILPNLSALKVLYLESVLEIPSFKTAPIEKLYLPLTFAEDDWPLVCRSKTLNILGLSGNGRGRNISPRIPWSPLRLPLLHTLELDDENWSTFVFDLPSLKRLRVGLSREYGLSGFPNLKPESVELDILAYCDNPEESEIEDWVKQLILKYPSIKFLEISVPSQTTCRNAITRLREERTWPSTLEEVRIVPMKGGE